MHGDPKEVTEPACEGQGGCNGPAWQSLVSSGAARRPWLEQGRSRGQGELPQVCETALGTLGLGGADEGWPAPGEESQGGPSRT